jgi:hypothetical protein
MSPTARTLEALRRDGWTAQVVESWIPRLNVRRDLFGVGDVLAVKPGDPPLLLQCTSGSHHAHRVGKSRQEPRLRAWLASGATFEVWSWSKVDDRWQCRRTPLVMNDMDVVSTVAPPQRQRRRPEPNLFAGAAI